MRTHSHALQHERERNLADRHAHPQTCINKHHVNTPGCVLAHPSPAPTRPRALSSAADRPVVGARCSGHTPPARLLLLPVSSSWCCRLYGVVVPEQPPAVWPRVTGQRHQERPCSRLRRLPVTSCSLLLRRRRHSAVSASIRLLLARCGRLLHGCCSSDAQRTGRGQKARSSS
jgi:hypothetical protein